MCKDKAVTRLPDLSRLDAETRARIEQTVVRIFAGREFHRVGLIEIARSANVSLQTVYKYYGSKEALLFSALDVWLGRLAVRILDHLKGLEVFKEKLRKVFWVTLDFFEQHPELIQLMLSAVYLNTWRRQENFENPELFGTFMRVLSEGRANGILNDEVSEKVLLDFFLGVWFRRVTMYVHRDAEEPLTEQANLLFEMLWRAISKSD